MAGFRARQVVVPFDTSDESNQAFRAALAFVDSPSAIHAIHIQFPIKLAPSALHVGDAARESDEKSIRARFDTLAAQEHAGDAELIMRDGDPGEEIARYAEEVGADLIIIPSHGYHGMKRLVLGSVAEKVLRHANCHVLVLRRSDAE